MTKVRVVGEIDENTLSDPFYILNAIGQSIRSDADANRDLPNKDLPRKIKAIQPKENPTTRFTKIMFPTGWFDSVTFDKYLSWYESTQDEIPILTDKPLEKEDVEKLVELEKWFIKVIPPINWSLQADTDRTDITDTVYQWYENELNRVLSGISPFCREDLIGQLKGNIILDPEWKKEHTERIYKEFNRFFSPPVIPVPNIVPLARTMPVPVPVRPLNIVPLARTMPVHPAHIVPVRPLNIVPLANPRPVPMLVPVRKWT